MRCPYCKLQKTINAVKKHKCERCDYSTNRAVHLKSHVGIKHKLQHQISKHQRKTNRRKAGAALPITLDNIDVAFNPLDSIQADVGAEINSLDKSNQADVCSEINSVDKSTQADVGTKINSVDKSIVGEAESLIIPKTKQILRFWLSPNSSVGKF